MLDLDLFGAVLHGAYLFFSWRFMNHNLLILVLHGAFYTCCIVHPLVHGAIGAYSTSLYMSFLYKDSSCESDRTL